ncbi:long-chain-fatty-acid--CoA ligase 1a isoform X1 [Lates japonicus]|uniref:Long-chain-fatty-acid--CoA ligase 1a isoform X1 n=1 Tax=Lates japonicus TaxID=270547 RepID=A0AAD3RML6_LATJO|nr:long-chain-fatty-acid--CoA ligase 1a isoform X1 [Lates japonicus]
MEERLKPPELQQPFSSRPVTNHSSTQLSEISFPPPSPHLSGQCRTAMQAQEVLRQLRIPELDDVRQYVRGLPSNALMGMGAFAAHHHLLVCHPAKSPQTAL